jgi:hypothetical protein
MLADVWLIAINLADTRGDKSTDTAPENRLPALSAAQVGIFRSRRLDATNSSRMTLFVLVWKSDPGARCFIGRPPGGAEWLYDGQ